MDQSEQVEQLQMQIRILQRNIDMAHYERRVQQHKSDEQLSKVKGELASVRQQLIKLRWEEAPKCEICVRFYSDVLKPKVLDCGHTVCIQCAQTLAQGNKRTMKCPFDRTITNLHGKGVKGLRQNYALADMLAKTSEKENSSFLANNSIRNSERTVRCCVIS